jgi:hypothetical protein
LRASALPSGEAIAVVVEGVSSFVVQIDRTGKPGWRDPLSPEPLGAWENPRGLLVFGTAYMRYYEGRGLVWQHRPDLPVLWGFPTQDGGAILACSTLGEPDPRTGPFRERISYIDPKGKRIWDKVFSDRTLLWAGSSLDGETIVTVSVSQGAGSEACIASYRRNGTLLAEMKGVAGLLSRAAITPSGDMIVAALGSRVAATAQQGRWTYQLEGEAGALSLVGKREIIVLVRPKADNPVMEFLGVYHLLSLSSSGNKAWEKRVASGSHNLWTDFASGAIILGTPDGLEGYDSSGARMWVLRTPSQVRNVSFFSDGSFLAVMSSGALVHYGR